MSAADAIQRQILIPDEDLRDFARHSSVPFHWVTPDGLILEANQAVLDMLGYEAEEYIGRNIAAFHADSDALAELLERRARGEAVSSFEAQLRCKDGSIKDVLLDSHVHVADGRVVHTSIIRDMSQRRALDEAGFRLAAIVESSSDAIVGKDLNGIVRSWNAGAERLFGYTSEDMVGRSIRTIIPADRQAEEDEVLRRVRGGEIVDHFETIRQRKDGSLVPISLTISPVKDRRGRIIGASKIARDITVQREAEEALRRTLTLKDQFLGLVSHELRTPISTIVGNAQLLRRRIDRLPEDLRNQALEDIASEGERLQRIIENLLEMTRLEAADELTQEPIDVVSLAVETVDASRKRARHREITLDVEGDIPRVGADRTLVALVLQNLITNANKYSPAATTIDVVVRQTEDGDVEVAVLDRGSGIPPDEVEQIFEPFYRSSVTKAIAPGMGLGLAVARKVLEAQGGSIRVEPRPGGGSVFAFRLPPFPEDGA